MGTIASQIISLTNVYSTVYSGADQRQHQSSASLAFVRGIHRGIPRTNGQLRGKCFHLMTSSWALGFVSSNNLPTYLKYQSLAYVWELGHHCACKWLTTSIIRPSSSSTVLRANWKCVFSTFRELLDNLDTFLLTEDVIQWFRLISRYFLNSWWRHQMETFSALPAISAGNSSVPGEFPAQRPVTRSYDVFFDLRLNKRLRRQ